MNKIELQKRSQKFAAGVIKFTETLPSGRALNVLCNQLIRSASSVGDNYRSACKGKSTVDFLNKTTICEEEADESIYWLNLREESGLVKADLLIPYKR
jgi:four helix bundle protein